MELNSQSTYKNENKASYLFVLLSPQNIVVLDTLAISPAQCARFFSVGQRSDRKHEKFGHNVAKKPVELLRVDALAKPVKASADSH